MDPNVVQNKKTFRLEITGLVQGVGFRPFIYRLADKYELKGIVENRNDGVIIIVNATGKMVEQFKLSILREAPPASDIEEIKVETAEDDNFQDFSIKKSEDVSNIVTEISPDIAVCEECLNEMESQPYRINYPFINCTNCGPRFSIIRDLPYDRPNTSMDIFIMCPQCKSEYENLSDRRFHAQPIACIHCGPMISIVEEGIHYRSFDEVIERVKRGIAEGKVFAMKGMGGFHLMCDAFNEKAVRKLRKIKERDGKPFALMFASLEEARDYVEINELEKKLLTSWQRPIVLLRKKRDVTPGIADGLDSLGIMLPYLPFHYLLFRALETKGIVLTSGNFSNEPIVISNVLAYKQFENKVDGVITYNREIINRNDDSVSILMNNSAQLIRRSRGYAPSPIRTRIQVEGIFAAGAELTSSFCMGKGKNAFMSQYIGDLKNFETLTFYEEIYERFSRMFRFEPGLIVHDLHPDYLSTKFSNELSEKFGGVPIVKVQHHHAHIASVMLANNLEGDVIGLSLDGMGLGSDGNIWGAEVMVAGYSDFRRIYNFEYIPLPGGDKANNEPWRMAVSYLYKCFGEEFRELPLQLLKDIEKPMIANIISMIDQSLNTPLISSAGRLFDAVSAILGLNYRATYQAEAPMLLESIADLSVTGSYSFEITGGEVSFMPMIREIIRDMLDHKSPGQISGLFHNTLIELMLQLVMDIRSKNSLNRVVLSGGTFQNRKLTENLVRRLTSESFEVFLPGKVPVNDQGIALGQLAIGAARR